jgi:hypothetical protein
MIPNDQVKETIVSRLKSLSSLVNLLPDGLKGIRELYWRGTDFAYPNVRVEIENQTDAIPNPDCLPAYVDFSIYVFSEHRSSQQADDIAGIIVAYIRGSSITINTVKFSKVAVLENIPATPESEITWRAQIRCRSLVNIE